VPEACTSNEVRIYAGAEVVVISWAERQELVGRLRKLGNATRLAERFEAAGASRPVELEPGDLDGLMDVLVSWQEGGGGPAPDGIRALAAIVWRARAGQ
jgi:hypothetical protein